MALQLPHDRFTSGNLCDTLARIVAVLGLLVSAATLGFTMYVDREQKKDKVLVDFVRAEMESESQGKLG